MSTTRREIQERKVALLRDLRLAHHQGAIAPGEMALSQRELSSRYGLSMRTIAIELQKLVEEGVLYTIPRVGTFVGRPQSARGNLFLAIFRYLESPNSQWVAVAAGFEERIAALGGTSLILDYKTARRYRDAKEIVAPAGIFEFHDHKTGPIWTEMGMPHAEFGRLHSVHNDSDAVYFNNLEGGKKATKHLLSLGHQKIAFLGLHAAQGDAGFFLWSQEREEGWRQAMEEAGLETEGLAFLPSQTPKVAISQLAQLGRETASRMLQNDEITAVVAVNAHTAEGLFQTLRAHECPMQRWPAVVGFDSEMTQSPDTALHAVTTLRLPWEEIGREAANLLWERSCGRLQEFEQRSVPMTLIPRLSCRQEWHRAPNMTSLDRSQLTGVT